MQNNDYNLKKFGCQIKSFRVKLSLTQKKIRELCGLNPDTLRKLEAGLTTPTIDTMIKLSEIYSINVYNILENCRTYNDDNLIRFRRKIDQVSYSDNLESIELLIKEIKEYSSIDELSFIRDHLDQLEILATVISMKNKSDILNSTLSHDMCYRGLRISKPNISLSKIYDYIFTPLEIRLLIGLSFAKSRLEMTHDSIRIMEAVICQLELHQDVHNANITIFIQAYYALSHFYYLLNINDKAINACNLGLSLSKQHGISTFLPYLLYRKGISELLLNLPSYRSTLKKCIFTLELLGLFDLKKKYLNVLKSKYNIDDIFY